MGCGKVRIFQPEIRRWTCFFLLLSHSFITNTFHVNWGDNCVCVPLIEGATRSGIAGGGRNGSAHTGRQNQRGGKMNVLKKKKRSLR